MYKYLCFIIFVGGFLMNNSRVAFCDGDYATPEIERKAELGLANKLYKRVSGKEPTLSNLSKSLEIKTATGGNSTEAISAIQILILRDIKTSEIINKVIKCHNNNLNRWSIRLNCAIFLLKVKKEKGIEISRSILKDPKAEIDTKLLIGSYLADVGNFEGYKFIKDGLLSNRINRIADRRLAISLLQKCIPDNGKQIASEGTKVDIKGLIDSVELKVDSETFRSLKKIKLQ